MKRGKFIRQSEGGKLAPIAMESPQL